MKAFGVKNNVTYQFEQGMSQAWVTPDIDSYTTKKALKISLGWDKVSEVNGYEIWVAKDINLKKGVKKYTAKYNEKSKNISITKAVGVKTSGISQGAEKSPARAITTPPPTCRLYSVC